MSLPAGLAVLLFGAAGLLGALALAARRPALSSLARILAGGGAVALLPALAAPASRPWAVFGIALGALAPRPLACAAAAAATVMVDLRPDDVVSSWALVVVGLAAAAATAAVARSVEAGLARGVDAGWLVAAAGAAVTVLLSAAGGGRVLQWGYRLGSDTASLDLPGAGRLLGVTLLVSLGGTLSLLAPLVSGSAHPAAPRLATTAGRKLLVLAAALAGLSAVFVVAQGVSWWPEALAASGAEVAGLVMATGVLVAGLTFLLGEPRAADHAPALDARAATETRAAASLALVALAVAGFEAWRRTGHYDTSDVLGVAAAGLLGLAALPVTGGVLPRRLLLLGCLLALLL